MTVTAARATPLSIPMFRRVWAGATVSAAGDSASWIALVALALGRSHASLPLLAALYTAPVAAGGLAAGWALDRFGRRRMMIADNLLRGAAFASIPVGALLAPPGAIQLYAVAACYGLLKMITLAGFPALIPSLVPQAQLDQANALEGASYGLASLAGSALAGVTVATVGAAPVIAFDAVSYLVLAVSLLGVRGPATATGHRAPAGAGTDARGQDPGSAPDGRGLGAVVRLAVRNPVLRDTTIMFALFNVGEGVLLVFLPHRALGLGLGAGGYGYLVTAVTGGELGAAVVLAWRPWSAPLRLSIVAAQIAAGLVVLSLIIPTAVTTVIALVVLGACSAAMTAWAQTLRMWLVPAEAHGRMFGLLRTVMQATLPLGAGLAALTMSQGAISTVIVVAAAITGPAALLARQLLTAAMRPAEDSRDGNPRPS